MYNPAVVIERGEALKNPPVLTRIAIRYKVLDPYGHVNNAVYLEFFEEIRLAYWRALADLAGIENPEVPQPAPPSRSMHPPWSRAQEPFGCSPSARFTRSTAGGITSTMPLHARSVTASS